MGVKARTADPPGQRLGSDEQGRWSVDDALPATVVRPTDANEAAQVLKECDQVAAGVVVWGGGTQMRLGFPPRRYQVAVSTDRMDQVLEYEPADLTCRVQAGVRLDVLQATLQAQGQRLPLDPARPARATVGGMVAANTSGLNRSRWGTVRDWVIGIAVAYPSGKVARAGGKVVKNVAGYDLMKLHIGALGTLGVVAEVNLKVQAIPQRTETVLARFRSAAAAVEAGANLARTYLAPAAAVVVNGRTLRALGLSQDWPATLVLKLEGYAKEVDAGRAQAWQAVRDAGGLIEALEVSSNFWDLARDWSAPEIDDVVLRAIGPMNALSAIEPALPGEAQMMLQPASGIAEVRVAPKDATSALRKLRAGVNADWQVIVASAPASVKTSVDVWGEPPPGFALMRALKEALDPNGIVNPGRFVGGL